MADKLTENQKLAINTSGKTIIVSAAAGSGKTSVLIERIITKITDLDHPCDVDKLLIVTFTRAATAEIRERLFTAVSASLKELLKNKDDKDFKKKFDHLKRQQMLIPSANIYTIDAFCQNLVRENFETLGLAPDFTLIDESGAQELLKQALEEILETYYSSKDKDFENLVELFISGKNDKAIEDTILKIYNFSRAFAEPRQILETSLQEYKNDFSYETSDYFKIIKVSAIDLLTYNLSKLNSAVIQIDKLNPLYATHPNYIEVTSLISYTEELIEKIFKNDVDNIELFTFSTWSRKSKGFALDENPYLYKNLKKARDDLKKDILALPSLFCENEQEVHDDIKTILPALTLLIKIVFELDERFMELKLGQSTLDFADVEHYAYELLQYHDFKPIQYEEILIDEYQDTNDLQDTIFRKLSKNEENLFMVGDIKQSIYGFRNAMPEIFNRKKNEFYTINLSDNFRSRKGILAYINFVFDQLMSKTLGDVDYDENERLNFNEDNKKFKGKDKEVTEPETELHVFSLEKDADNVEQEANFAADYIFDKINNCNAKYSDFAILMQKTSDVAPKVERILKERGIPVYSETGSTFLETADVMIVTSFLKCINNPTLDIPLLAVLMSPIYSFTPDEIAIIKIKSKQKTFFAKLQDLKDEDAKISKFLNDLSKYRQLSISLPAGELVRKIYEDTSFAQIVGAMPNGSQRIANLLLFLDYADSFDQTNSFGISSFIRYLESIEENNGELQTASLSSGTDNVVRIMSIHKSKGLQFKYCFLLNTRHEFNTNDLNESVLFDSDYGLGIKGRNRNTGSTYPTLMYVAIRLAKKQKLYSEFLRVLYVALTRAEEKLVIVGSVKKDNYFDKFALSSDETKIHYSELLSKKNFFDWLILATIRHPAAKPLRDLTDTPIGVLPSDFDLICEVHQPGEQQQVELAPRSKEVDKDLLAELQSRISFEYKYLPLSKVSTKLAASKVNKDIYDDEFFATSKPNFLNDDYFTPAQRGTCLHKFMQYFNTEKDLDEEIERIKNKKFLTTEELEIIDFEKVKGFLKSDIYNRIKSSPKVYKEKKFSVLIPALENEFEDEKILIQGIADLVFEEDNELVIVDYKTDRTKNEEVLKERHTPQLRIYADALEKVLGKPVKSAYLYAFSLDKEIKLI